MFNSRQNPIWRALADGNWLTRRRIHVYAGLLIMAYVIATAAWIALAAHGVDRNGKPIGTDFSDVYAAGTLLLQGKAADAYDPARQHAAEAAVFNDPDTPFFGWHYPPFFFAIAALVALFPYGWGLALWLIASFAGYLAMLRAILPRPETWLLALAFPAVFVNAGHGQNGFMTAALLGGALQLMNRRPWLSGVLIGCLAYKPQFGLMIPIALIAGARWSTTLAAIACVGLLVAATLATLGLDIWTAFESSFGFTQGVVLEQGGTGWEKIQSIFSAMRMWGASVPTAYAAQFLLAAILTASIAWLWRSKAAFDLKASALATACLLATPYVLDYDLVVLAVSIAFFARHGLKEGFRAGEITMLAAAWTVPLVTRNLASATGIPLGLLAMLGLYAVTLRRAFGDRERVIEATPLLAQA